MKLKLVFAGALMAVSLACNEYEDPPPVTPTLPDMPASQFNIVGRWDGRSDQGRPIRLDVTPDGLLMDGQLSLQHDCSGGQLVLQLSGYEDQVSGDTFSATMNWRVDDGPRFYVGTLTVSGRFESDSAVRGGFVNSVTEKQADNLGVCGPSSGTWEATKSE